MADGSDTKGKPRRKRSDASADFVGAQQDLISELIDDEKVFDESWGRVMLKNPDGSHTDFVAPPHVAELVSEWRSENWPS